MIVMSLLCCITLCIPCVSIAEPCFFFAMFCLGCAAFPTLAAIIATAVRLYNANGTLCASNTDVYMTLEH